MPIQGSIWSVLFCCASTGRESSSPDRCLQLSVSPDRSQTLFLCCCVMSSADVFVCRSVYLVNTTEFIVECALEFNGWQAVRGEIG